jgi:hypothetical protein
VIGSETSGPGSEVDYWWINPNGHKTVFYEKVKNVKADVAAVLV